MLQFQIQTTWPRLCLQVFLVSAKGLEESYLHWWCWSSFRSCLESVHWMSYWRRQGFIPPSWIHLAPLSTFKTYPFSLSHGRQWPLTWGSPQLIWKKLKAMQYQSKERGRKFLRSGRLGLPLRQHSDGWSKLSWRLVELMRRKKSATLCKSLSKVPDTPEGAFPACIPISVLRH